MREMMEKLDQSQKKEALVGISEAVTPSNETLAS
jgi:hypothetical protein